MFINITVDFYWKINFIVLNYELEAQFWFTYVYCVVLQALIDKLQYIKSIYFRIQINNRIYMIYIQKSSISNIYIYIYIYIYIHISIPRIYYGRISDIYLLKYIIYIL